MKKQAVAYVASLGAHVGVPDSGVKPQPGRCQWISLWKAHVENENTALERRRICAVYQTFQVQDIVANGPADDLAMPLRVRLHHFSQLCPQPEWEKELRIIIRPPCLAEESLDALALLPSALRRACHCLLEGLGLQKSNGEFASDDSSS